MAPTSRLTRMRVRQDTNARARVIYRRYTGVADNSMTIVNVAISAW